MKTLQDSPCFTSNSQAAGLYIHIPFCLRKCPYCDFYSITDLSFQSAFLDALASEMNMTRELDKVFDTLYIGGGTPSVLNINIIDSIIKTVHQCFITCLVMIAIKEYLRCSRFRTAWLTRQLFLQCAVICLHDTLF